MADYWTMLKNMATETIVETAFAQIDKSGKGEITVQDLKCLIDNINSICDTGVKPTEEDIKYYVAMADENKNGTLDLKEWKKLVIGLVDEFEKEVKSEMAKIEAEKKQKKW